MSFKEIADATGVSINTSLGRMRYAVLNLRRMAREHGVILQLDWLYGRSCLGAWMVESGSVDLKM